MENDPATVSPRAHFITMGCAKNEVDTREMQERLQRAGIAITGNLYDSDIVIVNTCSFIQAAVEESIDAILDTIGDEHIIENNVPVIVAGCMPARYGDDLSEELTEVASFVPCSKEDDIVKTVLDCLHISQGDIGRLHEGPGESGLEDLRKPYPMGYFAYVKISDGCDRFCTYCTIPHIRGRYHSFSFDSIRDEVKRLVDGGVKEIVLIGQDTGIWGRDLDGRQDLPTLLTRVAEEFPETWFRVMYTQPENVTDGLLYAMRDHDNIASYLDIPLQHCSRAILRAMNRSGSAEDFLELLAHARSTVPGIALRTTLMTGFPGETEEDFDALVEFIENAELDYVGIFAYSQEDGTKAASMSGQVDCIDKEARLSRLRDIADSVSNAVISKRIGSSVDVLIEGMEEDGQLYGRSYLQAPEVDGVTYIDSGNISDVVHAVIDDTLFYDMEATRL